MHFNGAVYFDLVQFMMRKIKEVDMDALSPSTECSAETLQKLKLALPEVRMMTSFVYLL